MAKCNLRQSGIPLHSSKKCRHKNQVSSDMNCSRNLKLVKTRCVTQINLPFGRYLLLEAEWYVSMRGYPGALKLRWLRYKDLDDTSLKQGHQNEAF